jgi:MarR-like DNA-binding transcriptional regulator SgrR of sgrS sRNA
MRQLQKIRQYQRLYQHYGSDPKPTTIAEVAETALCSERHARTLLRQLTQSGWLSWSAQPGRGHRAILHCLATTSELSAPLMHACLEKGDQSALQLADGDPASLHHIITPFLGGNGSSTSRPFAFPGIARSPRFIRRCSAAAPNNILSVRYMRD